MPLLAASGAGAMACVLLLAAFCLIPAAAFAKAEAEAPAQIGRFIHIALPITGDTVKRTTRMVRRAMERAKKDNARLVLVFEFNVPKGQKDFGRGSDFGAAYDLANFLSSEELAGVRTVAYLPNSIEGHAVLPVIACQEIIMAKDATIGAAGIDEKVLSPPVRSSYAEIAGRRRTVPVVIALGMLDPALEVLQVETEVDRQYVTPEGLEKLKKEHATKEPVVVKRAGEQCEFSGVEARRFGLAKYLAADRRDVAKALELPPTAIEDDPSLDGGWRAVRVDLKGPIRADSVDKAQHMIEEQIRRTSQFHLPVDRQPRRIGGGRHAAGELSGRFGSRASVRTVAYVPKEARSDAAIVALACDQLVVYPNAVLGGSGRSRA